MKLMPMVLVVFFILSTSCGPRRHILSITSDAPGGSCGPLGVYVSEGAETQVRVRNERVPFKTLAAGILSDMRGSRGNYTRYLDTDPMRDIRAPQLAGLSYLLTIDADIRYGDKIYKGVVGSRSVDEMECEPVPGGRCTLVSRESPIHTETSSRVQNVERLSFTLYDVKSGAILTKGRSKAVFTLKESLVQVLEDISESICR